MSTTAAVAASRPSPGIGASPGQPRHCVVRATGDLARRKLLPGLFHLAAAGLMPDRYGSSAHPVGLLPERIRPCAGSGLIQRVVRSRWL
jgi:glucose-6-phosphate 1-dehydrogenase